RFSRDWSSDVCSSDLQASTAERKQRIAAKERIGLLEPVGDMSDRVPRNLEDFRFLRAELENIPLLKSDIDAGDARRILFRPHDGATSCLFELQIATRVIAVMMSVEDMGKGPAQFLQLG